MSFVDELNSAVDRIYRAAMDKDEVQYLMGDVDYPPDEWGSLFAPFAAMGEEASDAIGDILGELGQADNAMRFMQEDEISEIPGEVEDWEGTARDNFLEYIRDTSIAIEMQRDVIAAVYAALDAHRQVLEQARTDVRAIVDNTLIALDALPDDGTNWAAVARIVGAFTVAAIGIAAAPVTGGTSVAATAAVFAGVSEILRSGVTLAAEQLTPIQGDTAPKVTDSMARALRDVKNGVEAKEERIREALGFVADNLAGPNRDRVLVPAGAYNPEQFTPPAALTPG